MTPAADDENDPERGLYGITVAADLVGMGVQNLRLYEARGLLRPSRTSGGTRRYSDKDLVRLRRIGQLLAEGLNLAGIEKVLGLESRVRTLESDAAARSGARSAARSGARSGARRGRRRPL